MRQACRLSHWPDVPIIMITAYGDAVTKRKTREGRSCGLAA